MNVKMWCVGFLVVGVVLLTGGFAHANLLNETYATNSTDLPTDYPSYSYEGSSSLFSVADNHLYIQDRNDGRDDFTRFTLMRTNAEFAGAIEVEVDLGCITANGGVGRISTGVMLGDCTADGQWIAFRFHPGYTGAGFCYTTNDWTGGDVNPGWTPIEGTLLQHMKIAYDGIDTFDVTLSEGSNSYTMQVVDSRLGGDGVKVALFSMNGGGYGTSNFDNLTVVPEPAGLALLASGLLGLLAYAWRRRR